MATHTPNLNLKKPEGTDYVLIGDLNGNMDIVDATIGKPSELNTAAKENIVAAINEARTTSDDQHAPYIGNNGHWYVWDAATSQFVDSDISATGGTGGGVPAGGATGTVFKKASGADFDTKWEDVTPEEIGAAVSGHVHGALTNDGKIGAAANMAIYTGADGALMAGALPPEAMQAGELLWSGSAASGTVITGAHDLTKYDLFLIRIGNLCAYCARHEAESNVIWGGNFRPGAGTDGTYYAAVWATIASDTSATLTQVQGWKETNANGAMSRTTLANQMVTAIYGIM